MGMAEVVPGVSGGTIAFISGIYERLINAIKKVSSFPIKEWRQDGFVGVWKHIDGSFLFQLGLGMVIGILIGVFGISYLLEHYPPIIWGFFFGLIIGSAFYIGQQVDRWDKRQVLFLVSGIAIAYFITVISPAEGSRNLILVFLAGAVAVSALILPGISGSFILLLLGMYTIILHTAKELMISPSAGSMAIVLVFIAGCITGLISFANVLSWTFKYHRFTTLAMLTGFMIGSLNRIWPWRNGVLWLDELTGERIDTVPLGGPPEHFHLLQEINVLPSQYAGSPLVLGTIFSFLFGLAIIYIFDRFLP